MRIACTGTSSTGKTTFARRAVNDASIARHVPIYVTADARELLREWGVANVDHMSDTQRRNFQLAYLERKVERENKHPSYISDRSFVDVAAYWLEYTGAMYTDKDDFVERCRHESTRYDLHLYFPPGFIQFERDGFRSNDPSVHMRIDERIRELLQAWGIQPVEISSADLDQRLEVLHRCLEER